MRLGTEGIAGQTAKLHLAGSKVGAELGFTCIMGRHRHKHTPCTCVIEGWLAAATAAKAAAAATAAAAALKCS